MLNDPKNIHNHFMNALKGEVSQTQKDSTKGVPMVGKNSIRYLPQHLIHAYYILRHIKSRDFKNQLLLSLNFFRSTQKRLMIDLREFGTRERIMGDQIQPIIPSEESNKVAQQNSNAAYFKKQQDLKGMAQQTFNAAKQQETSYESEKMSQQYSNTEHELTKDKQLGNIFEDGFLKAEFGVIDMKKFKFKGKFDNRIYSTCPILPRFHATFGEPIEFQPLNVEMERIGVIKHATDESIKLMGRVDHVEVDEQNKEVYIKDDFGIHIMYDCSLQDMKDLEEEVLKVGSYFIGKHESLINTELEKPFPVIDRMTLLEDLLECERNYQFEKVLLIQSYMECYEHISDPLEQQRLIQIIVNLMGLRPRLNLQSPYFKDSYEAEIRSLKQQSLLVRELVKTQMMIEKEENKRVQAYLDLTYRIATEQQKGKWTYTDAEEFFNELKLRKAQIHQKTFAENEDIKVASENQDNDASEEEKQKQEQLSKVPSNSDSPTKRFLTRINQSKYNAKIQHDMKLQADVNEQGLNKDQEEQFKENSFAAVLGLPPITVESLYLQYKEKDEVILEIMNENSNYIKVHEGYPDFMIDLEGLQATPLQNVKMNQSSLPINILDFYESLIFINKFFSTTQTIVQELNEVLKPHDNTLLTLIEKKVHEKLLIEFRKSKAFLEGSLVEYEGHQYIEDETIVGNPDKMMFYTKDFVYHLTKNHKQNINPFYIGKLDIESINFFDFPSVPRTQHLFKPEFAQLSEDMETVVKVSDANTKPNVATYQRFFPQLKEYMRKINIPSMLNLCCNIIEMLRLRQELISCSSECSILTDIYDNQCRIVNRQNFKVMFNDKINFDNFLIDQNKVNYIDDGAASFIDIDLAINEFDPMLKSNLNFRNPDAFKMLMCPSGLEELRAVVHYQQMQKQLLIIGIRHNQLIIDTHQRALVELELVKQGFSLPNMIVRVQNLLSKSGDGFSHDNFQKEKQKYQSNVTTEAAQLFYQVCSRKTKLRNTASKKFAVFLTSVTSAFGKLECSLRVLRAYKIKLLHSYCREVLKEAYHDCMKIQGVSICQKLRTFNQVFGIEEVLSGTGGATSEKVCVLKNEPSEYFENFFASYNPLFQSDPHNSHIFSKEQNQLNINSVINTEKIEIIDYLSIPSTPTLIKCESITYDEIRYLQSLQPSFEFRADPLENNVETSIKDMLPMLNTVQPEYPKDDSERSSIRMVDFDNSYDYSRTQFGQILTYYALIERIFHLEFFLHKMGSNLLDVLKMEHCVFTGLPFWGVDLNEEVQGNLNQQQVIEDETLAERILNKIVTEKRARVNLADDILTMANQLNSVLQRIQSQIVSNGQITTSILMNQPKALDYLILYQDFRYYYLIHTFEKLIDSYYQKLGAKEVKSLSENYNQIIKKDHIKCTFKHQAFFVNLALTLPNQVAIEPQNLFTYYNNEEERNSFLNCVQPILNEEALNPPQITLFEGFYTTPRLRQVQYAGQIPHFSTLYKPLETTLINFNEQERAYSNSVSHSIKGFLKDYLEVIHNEQVMEDNLTVDQLKKCKKFLQELIQARQLKNAMICWVAKSTLPLEPQIYNQFMQQCKNDTSWKILNQKDTLIAQFQNSHQQQQQQQMQSSKNQQNKDDGNQELALKRKEENKKGEQYIGMSIQLKNLQMQVLLDQVQTCRAEIIVLSKEIEKFIVQAAIRVVSDEAASLANCFQMVSKQMDMLIHPFQQFASTLYAQVDRNSHLDMVTKISEVQKFITKLKNRGTEVETLTSGPGMVFTVKDFNECIQMLCRGLIKYGEKEMRSRSEDFAKKEAHLISLLYYKDRRIDNLEERIKNTRDNIDKLINSKMYEKGNQLIYELDIVNRQLRLFKDNVFQLQKELESKLKSQFQDTIRQNQKDIEFSQNKFKDFKLSVTTRVKADLASEQAKIEKVLKKKAEEFKNLSNPATNKAHIRAYYQQLEGHSPSKHPSMNSVRFQGFSSVTNNNANANQSNQEQVSLMYSPNLQQLNQLSEQEAREELAQVWDYLRKVRIFWNWKYVSTVEKYERDMFTMKKAMTSNACLWEQLAEAEKREKVLKQELIFTQQSLAASEKVIEKLKDDLRRSEGDRIRLQQYKTNKSQRLEELEGKVRKFEVLENINLEKLIDTLANKEKELVKLKDVEKRFNSRIEAVEKKKDNEIKNVRYKVFKEQYLKQDILERLEALRTELRLLEKNEGSMAEVWKTKCKELVEISNQLKNENEMLRNRLVSVVAQNQSLEENNNVMSGGEQVVDKGQQYIDGSGINNKQVHIAYTTQFQLPKLMSNSSQIKMNQNITQSKFGYGGGVHSGHQSRHSSVIKNENQYLGISAADRSFQGALGGQNEVSTTMYSNSKNISQHLRGKSLAEGTPAQNSNQKYTDRSLYLQGGEQNKEHFAIFGQKAQGFKGYSSVRTSQIKSTHITQQVDRQSLANPQQLFKVNEDLNTSSKIQDLSNTSTAALFSRGNKTHVDKSPIDLIKSSKMQDDKQIQSRRTSDVMTAKISESIENSPLRKERNEDR